MAGSADDCGGPLIGRRVSMGGKRIAFFTTFYLCYAVFAALQHHYEWTVMIVVVGGSLGLRMIRPPTVVSAAGVRRPWRRPGIVHWSEVASVAAPQLGVLGVRLTLSSGKTVVLGDISSDRSAQVAAIGGKEVLAPRPIPIPPRAPGRRTDSEITADVERRAKALSDEWRRLDAQLPQRSPRPPPTG